MLKFLIQKALQKTVRHIGKTNNSPRSKKYGCDRENDSRSTVAIDAI